MSRKKQKDTAEKPTDHITLRRILQNNLYMLGIIWRSSPAFFFLEFLIELSWAAVEFFSGSFLLKLVVDRLEGEESVESLAVIVMGMCLIHMAVSFLQTLFWQTYSNATFLRMRGVIVKRLILQMYTVELSCYENPAYYEKYVKAMNEAGDRSFSVLWSLVDLVGKLFSLSANVMLLCSIDPFLMIFALIPFAVGFVRKARNKIGFRENEEIQRVDWRRSYIQRTFYLSDYAKEMRLSNMPSKLLADHRETVEAFKRIKYRYGVREAILDYIGRMAHEVVTIIGAGIYAVYATLVRGTMGVGDCLVVLNSIGSVSSYLQGLVTTVASFHDHALYIENLRSFLDYQPTIPDNTDGLEVTPGALAAEHVRYRYEGAEDDALRDITLHIRPGEKIALVGQNGSGKSTFVKLLLHLYEPTEGSITLDGRDMKDYRLSSWRDHFGIVFQDFRIFALSVAENVLMRPLSPDPDGRAADYARVEAALRAAGAWERVQKMPCGMDTVLTREFDDKGEVLSGGEAQKLAIARVFAGDAPAVILDEPTSALDPVAEYRIFENLMQACEGRTLIFISHRLSSAVLADRVYLFEQGRVTESGTHQALMAEGGRYADMFVKQAESYRASDAEARSREEVQA